MELDFASDLINPQGQNLLTGGSATLVTGLNLALYKDKAGFINNVTVGGLFVTDYGLSAFPAYWGGIANPSANGALFDTAMILTQSVTFGQYWTLENSFLNVISNDVQTTPCGVAGGTRACGTNYSGFPLFPVEQVKLSLNDSFTGWPITFNPYVTWYYELQSIGIANVSAACFSCQVNNYDFFIGMTPTVNLAKYWGIPVTVKAPTYVTVGPASFFSNNPDGVGSLFGASTTGNIGVFTTGLTFEVPLTWMPAQYGHWFAKAGFQWYDVINQSIQASNAVSTGCTYGTSACSSIFVGFGGIGVAF